MRRSVVLGAIAIAVFVGVALLYSRSTSPPSKKIVIYTYASFMSHWGPGPELKKAFEKDCQCAVEFVNTGDAGLLLQRLKFSREPVDLVLGLDQLQLDEASRTTSWMNIDLVNDVKWQEEVRERFRPPFVPFDWAPMTFIYREGSLKPADNLRELIKKNSDLRFSLQDPRTSSPGLQFLYWLFQMAGGNEQEFKNLLLELKPKIHSFSSSWSSAYGLFQDGQVDITFSYLTSLLYHWLEEKKFNYKVLSFASGHPVQVEYVGIPAKCSDCDLAKSFIEFLLEPGAQDVLLKKNYMLPVLQQASLPDLPELKAINPDKLPNKEDLIQWWQQVWQ